jgi:ankyrin repeat protein
MRADRWLCLFCVIIGSGFFFAGIGSAAAGQVKVDKEGEALPVVTTTVKGELPWARRIGQGGEIRVKIPPQNLAAGEIGRSIRFKVKNLNEGESVFTIKAFRNGQPIKMDIEETYSLRNNVEALLGFQNKAEEVAVRVEKGKVIAAILAEESPFAKDKTKSFFIMTGIHDWQEGLIVDAGRPLRLIITSDSQDGPESKVKVKFYKGDYKNEIDEAEVVLKNGQTKTWEYSAKKGIKTLDIFVAKKGGVKVRLDQREPFQLTKDTKNQISLAIQNNNQEEIKTFLDSGLDANATLQGDGTSVLMKASNSADVEMVKMLLARGADINYTNKYGWTALLKALDNRKHWTTVTPVLIKSGADVNATLKSNGYTPLWKAIGKIKKNKGAAIKIIKSLLSKGADANAPYISKDARYSGETPLMSASKKGSADVVKLLLSHGADVNARTKAGKTALDYAREKGHQEVVKLLATKGVQASSSAPVQKKAKAASRQPVKKTTKALSKPSLPKGQKEILGGEIPMYEGAKIIRSTMQGNRGLASIETNDSPEKVMNFYKAEMISKGWSVKTAVAKSNVASLSMYKEKKGLLLTAGQRSGKTSITLMFSK